MPDLSKLEYTKRHRILSCTHDKTPDSYRVQTIPYIKVIILSIEYSVFNNPQGKP